MCQEIKICLPIYKMVYSVCFVVCLSLARGITHTDEIGIALEAPMAILAFVFCADTYTQEIVSKRSEIHRLYPLRQRVVSIFRRIIVQEVYLLFLSLLGYGLFIWFQKPTTNGQISSEIYLFLMYVAAVLVTINFWGVMSHAIACLSRNMWAGIGSCLFLWVFTNSQAADQFLGNWNLFSYTFRMDGMQYGWICGKIVCICLCTAMLMAMPSILKKRG